MLEFVDKERVTIDGRNRIRLARDFFLSLAVTRINRAEQELVAGFYSAYQPLNTSEALQLERELGKVTPDMVRETSVPVVPLGVCRTRVISAADSAVCNPPNQSTVP